MWLTIKPCIDKEKLTTLARIDSFSVPALSQYVRGRSPYSLEVIVWWESEILYVITALTSSFDVFFF